jgi:hypothetical protein
MDSNNLDKTIQITNRQIEIIKLKAIQEYLLQHGANDEEINDKLRELESTNR